MTFRKDSIRFYEGYFIYFLMITISLVCSFLTESYVFLLLAIPFVFFAIFNKKQFPDIITVDEKGIVCRTTEEVKWEYDWEDIAELQKFTRFRSPSIEIVVYVSREPEKLQSSDNYFQLSRKAKKALKTYYDHPIEKFKRYS